MSDPQPPDYKAEAREWCRRADPGKSIIWEEDIESLAALLERLCGEAKEAGYNKAHAKWVVDYGRAQAQLAEAQKERDYWQEKCLLAESTIEQAREEGGIERQTLNAQILANEREEGFRECDGQWQMVVGFAVTGMEREKVIAQVREEGRREMGQKIEGLIRDRLGPAYFDIVEHMLREAKP